MSEGNAIGWKEEIEELVGTARFELATPCTPSKCATRLRYVPTESAVEHDSAGLTSRFYTRSCATGDSPPGTGDVKSIV
jgi:hypothetical protein